MKADDRAELGLMLEDSWLVDKAMDVIGEGKAGCKEAHKVKRFIICLYFCWYPIVLAVKAFFIYSSFLFSHNANTHIVYAIALI
jgi:hypothetical protein